MTAQPETQTLRFRLVCENPPPDDYEGKSVSFGLQDKLGSLLLGDAGENGTLVFDFELDVRLDGQKPVFVGVYAQGTPRERFLYLSLGFVRDDQWEWVRRIKITLTDIPADLIAQAQQQNGVITGRVDGRGAATTSLLGAGWHILL